MERDQRPIMTGEEHDLPFHQLSPERFEQLCVWLLDTEGFEKVEHYGARGSDGGRDLTAVDAKGRHVVGQCKRYAPTTRFGVGEAKAELDKVLEPKEKPNRAPQKIPDHFVLLMTAPISAEVRDYIQDRLGSAEATFYDLTRLNQRVRQNDAICQQFFRRPGEVTRHRFNLKSPNGYFQGREDLLDRLAQRLRDSQAAALTQAITGLGGVGKTQIALRFCYQHDADYDHIFWFDASTPESLRRDYADAGRRVAALPSSAPDDKAAAELLKWLSGQSAPWLAVLDNADEPESLLPKNGDGPGLPKGPTGHVLVTSRRQTLPGFGAADSIEVDVLPVDDAIAFLLRRSGRSPSDSCERLVEELGRLPLALEQAGGFLKENPSVSVDRYLGLFGAMRLKLLEAAQPSEGDYPMSVATTWIVNLERVEAEAPAAAEVLRVLAFYAPDGIPVDLIRCGLSHFGPASAKLASRNDELDFDLQLSRQVLSPLHRYSLATIPTADGDGEGAMAMHRLVQAVILDGLEASGEIEAVWWAAFRGLEAFVPEGRGDSSSDWPRWRQALPHLLAHAPRWEPSTVEPTALWHRAGWFCLQSGASRDGQRCFEQEVAVRRRVLGEEHPDTLTSMGNLATTLRHQGDWGDARSLEEQVLEVRRRVLGEEHPNSLTAMGNLASTLGHQGDWAGAFSLEQQVLEVRRRVLGKEHPDTLAAMNNLAMTLRHLGELELSRDLELEVVEGQDRVLGECHPYSLAAICNLMATLQALEEKEEVERWRNLLRERADGIDLPPHHPVHRWLERDEEDSEEPPGPDLAAD